MEQMDEASRHADGNIPRDLPPQLEAEIASMNALVKFFEDNPREAI